MEKKSKLSPSSTIIHLLLFSVFATTTPTFTIKDNLLIDCGGTAKVTILDGRSFETDEEAHGLLEAEDKCLINDPSAKVPSPIYSTARIFLKEATYTFPLQDSGWHWVRLHFFPLNKDVFKNLERASIHVFTDEVTLLHSYSYGTSNTVPVLMEYQKFGALLCSFCSR